MYCRNCGKQMGDNAVICTGCGVPKGRGTAYCPNCGEKTSDMAVICVKCGCSFNYAPQGYEQKSRLVAGLLGIFLGGLGVHNFYLGFTSKAVIQIVVSIVTCGIGSIWGFIEGILILCGHTNTDSNNIPLKDI